MGKSGLSLGLLLLLLLLGLMLLLVLLGLLLGLLGLLVLLLLLLGLLGLLVLLLLLLMLLLLVLLGLLLLLLLMLGLLVLLGLLLGLPPSCASVTCCFASYMRPLLWRLPMADAFRALCAELVDAWLKGDDIVGAMNRARAALADESAVPQGKEPASVTGQSRPTVPTIDDVWELCEEHGFHLGIDGANEEESANGLREIIFTALARWGTPNLAETRRSSEDAPTPPADGEVAERAAELLQRQALVPVSVSERPWEREGWCDSQGRCWLGSDSVVPDVSAWIYGPAVWAERFPDIHRLLLPAHALPLPEVSE